MTWRPFLLQPRDLTACMYSSSPLLLSLFLPTYYYCNMPAYDEQIILPIINPRTVFFLKLLLSKKYRMLTEAEKNLTQGKDIHMSPVYIYIPLLSTICAICILYIYFARQLMYSYHLTAWKLTERSSMVAGG